MPNDFRWQNQALGRSGCVPSQFIFAIAGGNLPATGGGGGSSYTQAIVPTSGTVPTTGVLTYTLNAPLGVNVIITPADTTATFSPTTVTILAGHLTGTTTGTFNYVGISTISSTNNQGLSDPANITFDGSLAPGTGGSQEFVNIGIPFTG